VTTNDPVKAERADYFDAGVTVTPLPGLSIGLSAYYKIAQNLLDEGQFGAPHHAHLVQLCQRIVKGVELATAYDQGPWSVYSMLPSATPTSSPSHLSCLHRNITSSSITTQG